MKDILEYSKQAPNDYPFVYQDTMERVFAEDFNKALVEYEDRLLKNISNYLAKIMTPKRILFDMQFSKKIYKRLNNSKK